jgi:S1-C subfamily serine protease
VKKSVFKLSPSLLLLFVCGCSTSPHLAPEPPADLEKQNYYGTHPRPDLLFEKAVHSVVLLASTNESYRGAGVITPEGNIITNLHIANHSKKWWVRFYKSDVNLGASREVEDKERDLALLKVKPDSKNFSSVVLNGMELGEVSDLKVGQQVFCIAHPMEQDFSFWEGRISRLDDDFEWFYNKNDSYKAKVIQIQMPRNKGNSGGPIFDNEGRLIGILTTGIMDGESLSYAIRIDEIKKFLDEVKQSND